MNNFRTGLLRGGVVVAAVLLGPLCGCFSQRGFPPQPGDVRLITPPAKKAGVGQRVSTRTWLEHAHAELDDLLRAEDPPALLTDDLTDESGEPVDVYRVFNQDPGSVHTVFGNFDGVLHSAQATGADLHIENPAPRWPGCEQVWIPVEDGIELSGQLGFATRNGERVRSTCIVILPGFFGDTGPRRSRDLSQLFLSHGFHVLGLEQRGAGQTEVRRPDVPYTFGVLETGDLLAVAEWLEAHPEIERTGMIGFCWGANHVLLAAWEEGRPEVVDSIPERLRAVQRTWRDERRFEAGVIAFSPTLRFEQFADRCERPHSVWTNAIVDRFQGEVEERQRRKGIPVTGSLRELVDSELERSPHCYPKFVADGYDYLRFMPYRDLPVYDKLERARVPTLIVHAVNDPMGNAQDVPDLIATVDNEQVAAVMLPGGGHLGFAPYARGYFYSLLINFFDGQRGPAAE